MQDVASGAIAFLGTAVFHAAVHVAGHESFSHLKLGLHKRLLRNHDVARALREAYAAALKIVEEHYLAAGARLPKAEVKRTFGALRMRAVELFPLESAGGPLADETIEIAIDESKAADLASAVADCATDVPPDLRNALREEFPGAFRYAFMEIGIKRNELVRAAVTQELLMSLQRSAAGSDRSLEQLSQLLTKAVASLETQEQHQRFQAAFQDSTSRNLQDILDRVAEIADFQQNLMSMVGQRLQTTEAPRAFVVISDADDSPLAYVRVCSPEITFGRDASNPIPLPHKTVGRQHATLTLGTRLLELQDLGSKNGTYLNGKRIDGRTPVKFGDEIAIGPFRLALHPPEASLGHLVTFETVLA
jgi:hypothetical protein